MRSDIVPGAVFPDYELPDHATKRWKLSEDWSSAHEACGFRRAATKRFIVGGPIVRALMDLCMPVHTREDSN
jgi:hypothetical protein